MVFVVLVTIILSNIIVLSYLLCTESTNCQDGDVRLVDGDFVTEGRLEVCSNGIWGTVCGTGFNAIDAYVVCKELGLGLAGVYIDVLVTAHIILSICFRTYYIYQFIFWWWRYKYIIFWSWLSRVWGDYTGM